jgi:hypothetical protein
MRGTALPDRLREILVTAAGDPDICERRADWSAAIFNRAC